MFNRINLLLVLCVSWCATALVMTSCGGESTSDDSFDDRSSYDSQDSEPLKINNDDDDGPDSAAEPIVGGEVETLLLYDPHREKELQMRITYPALPGKLPIIIYSHFSGGTKDQYRPLIDHWVQQGFVCIQPDHSDSPNVGGKRGEEALADTPMRPLDISFIINSLVEIEQLLPELAGRLDHDRIGVGGQYLGAYTANLLVGMKIFEPGGNYTSYLDERVDAALLMSPQGTDGGVTEDSWENVTAPVMVLTGTNDPSGRTGNDAWWRTEPYEFSPAPDKYRAFIEDLDSKYDGLVDPEIMPGDSTTTPTMAESILRLSTQFWLAHLVDDGEAFDYVNSDEVEVETEGLVDYAFKPFETGPVYQAVKGPYEIVEVQHSWTDTSRDRDVAVTIYAPDGGEASGPYPVVMFSHGAGESRDSYPSIGRFWARYGYVVVVVNHEGSDTYAIETYGIAVVMSSPQWELRPADISFALDQLELGNLPTSLELLELDFENIAMVGHSLGSTTALAMGGMTFNTPAGLGSSYLDARMDALIAMSPQIGNVLEEPPPAPDAPGIHVNSWDNIDLPVLMLWGSRDFGLSGAVASDPNARRTAYDSAESDTKYLVLLDDAAHHAFTDTVPWYPAGEREDEHMDWIQEVTTALLDSQLRSSEDASRWLRDGNLQTRTAGAVIQESTTQLPL